MTNWVAGHTDRFRAIVTHAGLYALDQQHTTTEQPWRKNRPDACYDTLGKLNAS